MAQTGGGAARRRRRQAIGGAVLIAMLALVAAVALTSERIADLLGAPAREARQPERVAKLVDPAALDESVRRMLPPPRLPPAEDRLPRPVSPEIGEPDALLELLRAAPQAGPVPRLPLPPADRPASGLVPPGEPAAPRLAVIIDDLGPARRLSERVTSLPAPLTLAFLPYAPELPRLTRAAADRGHEIFLHLPMEPVGDADPGPNALLSGLPEDELEARILWALDQVPMAVGVNNHMGSRLTADAAAMAAVMRTLARRQLLFLDSRTSTRSVALPAAAAAGVPSAGRDVFLDVEPTESAIRRQLALAERVARRNGDAIVIGHPYPATIEVLASWLDGAAARGLEIVPASAIVTARWCADPQHGGSPACEAGPSMPERGIARP